MPISEWSDYIFIAELTDEPAFTEDLDGLHRRLEERGDDKPDVILNMKGVTRINSTNLGQLLRLRKTLTDSACRLRLCSVSDPVWSVFLVSGLDKFFECTDDVSTSLASLQLGPG